MKDLAGKVAVVTGAGAGIGLAVAEAFAAEGMKVVLADLPTSAVAEHAARLPDAIAVPTDVRLQSHVDALAAATLEAFGTVHVLVNNAGIVQVGQTVWAFPDEVWDRVLGVNLRGMINGLRAFVPLLLANGDRGHVVNMSSMAGVMVHPTSGPYNVSKHGVLALTETLALELAAVTDAVKVTCVFPGQVSTPMGRTGLTDDEPDRPGMIKAPVVAQQIVDAIRAEQLFLFTHPERVQQARDRFARLVGDVP